MERKIVNFTVEPSMLGPTDPVVWKFELTLSNGDMVRINWTTSNTDGLYPQDFKHVMNQLLSVMGV